MILITGGGTGGHLAVAKSLKAAFLEQNIPVIYVGSTKGQDRAWFEDDPEWEAQYFLDSQGVVNKRGIQKLLSVAKIAKEAQEAKKILQKHNIKAVVSVGGYSAAPASIAAIFNKTPLFIHEQNAVAGRLNRLLKPFAKRFFCSFLPPFDPYPVAKEYYRTRRLRTKLQNLIFLGGSQGARQINDIALALAPKLHKKRIGIIHQCGKHDFKRVAKAYKKMGIEAELFDFDPNIAQKIRRADLAIARAGASTVWELAANGLPALFVPYPYAAGDHQRKNAQFIEQKGGARLWSEEINIFALHLESMSRSLMDLFEPEGAQKIATQILKAI